MKAIFKKEFKTFFTSPIGYIFIAINLFLIGIYFMAYNLQGSYPYFAYTLNGSIIVTFITIPILTMRILAEERKNKTDQLILTAPVSVGKIVLGKYLALLAIIGIVIGIICFYPIIMRIYGNIPMKEAYNSVLGFALYSFTCAAVGLFISGLTENQIISAVLSFTVIFLTYFMQGLISIISSTGNAFTNILSVFDFLTPFDSFINGSLNLTYVVYFVSIIILMLFLTAQTIQKRRYSVSVKNLALSAYSSFSIVVAIVITVIVNIIARNIPAKYMVFDVTTNNLYSITDETKDYLNGLEKDVTIYVLCKEENYDSTMIELLKRYEGQSDKVSVEYVNTALYPNFAKTYTNSAVSTGSVIVVSGDKSKVVSYDDMYEYTQELDYTTYSYNTTYTGFDGEGQITSAIAYVTGSDMPTVYYTQGHGEYDLSSKISDVITKANLGLSSVTILTEKTIPEDAEVVVINNPTTDFSEDDITALEEYIQKGGNIIINLLASGEKMPVLWGFLEKYGITVSNALVMDGNANNYYTYPLYLLPEIKYNEMTSTVYSNNYIFAPYTLSMQSNGNAAENASVTALLVTSDEAYAKDVNSQSSSYEKEEGDLEGSFIIAGRIDITNEDKTSTIFVNSCGQLFEESTDQMVGGANSKLFASVLSSMSTEIDSPVSIPVKSFNIESLTLSSGEIALWRGILLIVIPFGLIIIGLLEFLRRRRK